MHTRIILLLYPVPRIGFFPIFSDRNAEKQKSNPVLAGRLFRGTVQLGVVFSLSGGCGWRLWPETHHCCCLSQHDSQKCNPNRIRQRGTPWDHSCSESLGSADFFFSCRIEKTDVTSQPLLMPWSITCFRHEGRSRTHLSIFLGRK